MTVSEPTIPAFTFHRAELEATAARLGPAYRVATPYPHTIIDDFLPGPVAERVLAEFPGLNDIEWGRWLNARENKLATTHEELIGPFTRQLIGQLNSGTFIDFLEALTGVGGLIPDPHLLGGGLHQIVAGGFLKVHADFNRHDRLDLDRRLNLLLYLNHDWPDEYGGHLELWDRDMTECVQRIAPLFNRCVVFSTTSFSYHGHPHPLTCPADRVRRSLALYYYSNGRPASEIVSRDHSTLFRDIPGEHTVEDLPVLSSAQVPRPPRVLAATAVVKAMRARLRWRHQR